MLINSLLRIGAVIFVLLHLFGACYMIYGLINGVAGSTLITIWGLAAYTVFLVVCLHALVRRMRLVRFTKITLGLLLAASTVLVAILAIGLIKDMTGEVCIGLWGVEWKCIADSYFLVSLFYFGAFVLPYTSIALFALFSFASYYQLRPLRHPRPRQHTLAKKRKQTKTSAK